MGRVQRRFGQGLRVSRSVLRPVWLRPAAEGLFLPLRQVLGATQGVRVLAREDALRGRRQRPSWAQLSCPLSARPGMRRRLLVQGGTKPGWPLRVATARSGARPGVWPLGPPQKLRWASCRPQRGPGRAPVERPPAEEPQDLEPLARSPRLAETDSILVPQFQPPWQGSWNPAVRPWIP